VPSSAVVDGLVAWYRFADNSNTAIDYTAELDDDRFADTTPHDGTVNGASFVQNGGVRDVVSGANPSGAYDFDGVDDFIAVNENLSESEMTVTMWVQQESFPTSVSNFISDVQVSAGEDNFIRSQNSGSLAEFKSGGSVISVSHPGSGFHHYAFTNDGSSLTAFIDGSQVGSTRCNPPNFLIGNFSRYTGAGLSDRFVDGIMDDIRYYNRALPLGEINQIFTNTEP
jgi:hypothetical protein